MKDDGWLDALGSVASVVFLRPLSSVLCRLMSVTRIRRLSLTNFRSYRAASLAVGAGLVVLVGPNGAGKTNLIEAISFLAPGRGLRRATLEDVAFSEGDGSWAVSADVEGALAQPAARRRPPRCALARRHRARNGRARGRGDGATGRNRQPAAGRPCRAQRRGV